MNDSFIIISEHRVGSRWMHYLFADLLGMKPSPEMDRDRLRTDGVDNTYELLKNGRIPKFHRATYWDIESAFGEGKLKVLGVVRNPRDRAVSLAFHNRYHRNHHFKQRDFETDQEAVEWTVLNDTGYKKGNLRQLSLMIPGCYVLNNRNKFYPYVWVDYESLVSKTGYYIDRIIKILDLKPSVDVEKTIELHSFKEKSKRNPGQEIRSNLWKRKGIVGDHVNWFTDDMYERSFFDTNCYEKLLDEDYWG